jgi:malonate transporter and related proteins
MFLNVLLLVIPVFALMGLGFIAMKRQWLPEGGHKALAAFGFNIAIPAMLFKAMLGAEPLTGSPVSLLAAYLIPVFLIWFATTLLTGLVLGYSAVDRPGLSMASTFGNTVMLGIPISLMAFGPGAATPIAILISVEAVLLWIIATVQIEFARQGSGMSFSALGGVLRDLSRNTVVMALILGFLGHAVGFKMPDPVDRTVALLGQAGVPVALFALGMALAGFRLAGDRAALGLITVVKLAALPLLAFLSASAMGLPKLWIAALTLHAAMPVGANPFIFAMRYDRNVPSVSAMVALSTAISVLTITGVIVALKLVLGV